MKDERRRRGDAGTRRENDYVLAFRLRVTPFPCLRVSRSSVILRSLVASDSAKNKTNARLKSPPTTGAPIGLGRKVMSPRTEVAIQEHVASEHEKRADEAGSRSKQQLLSRDCLILH